MVDVVGSNTVTNDAAVVVINTAAGQFKALAAVMVGADGVAVRPASTARLLSAAASVNSTLVKNSAGYVLRISGFNAAASARYLKLYNKATAPTVGTDTPVHTEYLAATAKFVIDLPAGLYFATGIGFGLTTAAADADTGALTAADVLCLNVAYA